ncbi:microtubule organization protein AKNA isoform X1 [Hypanus sabinus]|uniref:microtubule organization protein AKNA isoform X1 n=1 Tax=Hypanus sabinus TaxID=79690 RepID=UPI0028C43A11|nr:microtubule organization protein AKNA isoform X1 [Hypanus sabinus]XP_059850025.1 microtubule organization protein AKNA isoform X1 [Hypanus sabinus]XP_059850026.1 microtubule organization protein AKNA isoform X1 [Hypanus sabinus]XP_059850027.1 microtubule organization protein AKNA isoform X1 [Hypanus sabinus]XP_059850028.1 microtubule organization protein AKNA isoform X1 [Hypanus sabinus]
MEVSETQELDTDLELEPSLEDQDEDIFSHMDENGIIGMDEVDEYYLQYPLGLEESLETDMQNDPKLGIPENPQDSMDDESFNISEFQDSDAAPLSLSTEEDPSPSHLMYESDPQEEDKILNNQHYEQGEQSDRTENKKDLGSHHLQNERISVEHKEDEEDYPDLLYKKELAETNPDLWGRYRKTPSLLNHGDDFSVQRIKDNTKKLSDQPIGRNNRSKTQCQHSSLAVHDYYSEDFETRYSNDEDHLGGVLELSSDSRGCASQLKKEGEDNSSSNRSGFHFNQVMLERLSVEDLANEADIEAESIPGSSCSDSVGESVGGNPEKERTSVKDLWCGNKRHDQIRHPGVSKTASNGHIELNNCQTHPYFSKPLTDKNSRQLKTLNPQRGTVKQRASTKPLPRKINSETAIYGRGQLNYPLPDFSKVEPRVKFPKDVQVYQKPKSKVTALGKSRTEPHLFQSPAEIVRQVLQNSSEWPLITPTPSEVKVVGEFRCPQQATEMVYQLQEDYRRLLTKYAEAENTIDRLRIGAKVNLFVDPPNPGHSFQGETMNRASKVMTFAISHPQKAKLGPSLDSNAQTECQDMRELPGTLGGTWISSQNDPTMEPTAGNCLNLTLAQQIEVLQEQIGTFETFLKARKLSSGAQLKAFQKLREGQDALERGYLQAREKYRGLQQQSTSANSYTIGNFDPNREMEGNIFRLGMRLEDMREQIDQVPETSALSDHSSDDGVNPSSWITKRPAPQPCRPEPIVQPPKPVLQTTADTEQDPKHQNIVPSATFQLGKVDAVVSSVSGDSENEDAFPTTLKHKKMQLEESFDQLLDQCGSFKDLPLSLDFNKVGQIPESPPLPLKAFGQEVEGVNQLKEERMRASYSDMDVDSRKTPEPRQPMKMQKMFSSGSKESQQPVLDRGQMPPNIQSFQSRTMSADSTGAYLTEGAALSPGKSDTRVDGIVSPVPVPYKTLFQVAAVPPEEGIISPETDSGFVGSEVSRITPAVRSPEHHHPLSRSPSQRETLLRSPPGGMAQPKQALSSLEAPQRGANHHFTISQDRQGWESIVQGGHSQTSSPQFRVGSTINEFEQDTFISHMESEADGLGPCAGQRCQRSSLISSPLTSHPKVQYSPSLLNIRSTRDELIQALQAEVSQLRDRLQQILPKPQGDSERNSPPPRPRRHVIHRRSLRRKLSQKSEEEGEGQTSNKPSASHSRSKPIPHFGSEPEISTESEILSSFPHPPASKKASISQINERPSPSKIQRSRPIKGPYTGTDYSFFVPQDHRLECGNLHCPSCSVPEVVDGPLRTAAPLTSSPRSNRLPVYKGLGMYNDHGSDGKPKHFTKDERKSSEGHKGQGQQTIQTVESPVAIGYVPAPYYLPAASQVCFSAPAWTYVPPTQSHIYYRLGRKELSSRPNSGAKWSKSHHDPSSPLRDSPAASDEAFTVLDLNSSLDQLIKAAKSMKWTTLKMVKSLTTDLCKVKTS